MVSCDTPEKAIYAGKPEVSQPKLDKCKERLEGSFYSGRSLTQEFFDFLKTFGIIGLAIAFVLSQQHQDW